MDESYIYIAHAYMIYKLSQPIQSWFDSGMLYKIAGTPLRYPKAQLLDMKNFFFFWESKLVFTRLNWWIGVGNEVDSFLKNRLKLLLDVIHNIGGSDGNLVRIFTNTHECISTNKSLIIHCEIVKVLWTKKFTEKNPIRNYSDTSPNVNYCNYLTDDIWHKIINVRMRTTTFVQLSMLNMK